VNSLKKNTNPFQLYTLIVIYILKMSIIYYNVIKKTFAKLFSVATERFCPKIFIA
jgi:hypothetical protein